MSKNPKSIVISFRLSPAVVAKAIDGLKNYDKTANIATLSGICKQATLHGINYLTHALPFEPSKESQVLVHNLTTQGKERSPFESSILGQPLRIIREERAEEENTNFLNAIATKSKPRQSFLHKETAFHTIAEENTKSINSVVTDFSIPKSLLEEAEEGKEDE